MNDVPPPRRRRSHGSWQMIQTKLWVLVAILVIIAVLGVVGVLMPAAAPR